MSTEELGLELPVEIIQRIQSFMNCCKLSAQTSLLSKTWYKAWSTRPTLYFRYSKIPSDHFLDLVKTVERYLALNLKLDKFVLETGSAYVSSLVDKLIIDLLNLRVNILDLCFYNHSYVLPAQVFAHKYLTELRLCGVKVDHLIPLKVMCSNLRSLTLECVSIDDNTFTNILIRCPIIEHLDLCTPSTPLTRINATELQNLKTLIVTLRPFGLEKITSSVICGQFLNLTGFTLRNVGVADSVFTNLSSSFPNLEDLNLEYNGHRGIQISNRSIKRLYIKNYGMLEMVHFDVPNIRNFKIECNCVPPLSFTTSSREWKSEITFFIVHWTMDSSKVRDFLIELSHSKITLYLSFGNNYRHVVHDIEVSRLPVVEELTCNVTQTGTNYNFFIDIFLCCRPKIVSIRFSLDGTPDMILFMYTKLIELSQNCFSNSTQYSSKLEEVNVEIFEESLKQWQPINALSDDLEILNLGAERLRFKLKWGSFTPEQTIIKFIQY